MNIRDLEYLVALAQFEHFHKAADHCNVSQPTLSGQIRKLENELGINLLERTSRKVLFTQFGLTLVEQAKVILREVKMFREMASNQGKDMSGPLNIAIIPTLAPYLLPKILPNIQEDFPDLELHIHEMQTTQIVSALESGQIDCALLAQCDQTSPFIEVPIFEEEMLLGVSKKHAWAKREQLPLSELADKEVLLVDDSQCLHEQTLNYCLSVKAKEDKKVTANHLETLKNLIAANMGISILPKLAQSNCEKIHYLSFSQPKVFRTIEMIYRPGSPLKSRYEKFAKYIRELQICD